MTEKEQWIAGFCYGMYIARRLDGTILFDIEYRDIHKDLRNMWEAIAEYQYLEVTKRNRQ